MLAGMEKNPGVATPLHDVRALPKLEDLGISYIQSHRYQLEASVPDELERIITTLRD